MSWPLPWYKGKKQQIEYCQLGRKVMLTRKPIEELFWDGGAIKLSLEDESNGSMKK
jgi:hypothetical protein